MAHVDAIDISRWQGNINWGAVPQPIAIMKMSGGDGGVYVDSMGGHNYYAAKAAGKAVGQYHFAGGGNPVVEAEFFVKSVSPLEKFDVLVLDWEVQHADPVGWCTQFVNRVHEMTGIWPLIYMNLSTLRSQNWDPVLANCGLWVAAWGVDPENDLNTGGKTYVMHQYTSDGSVAGIAGRVDMDAWFGTVDQFKQYGYQATDPAPTPPPPPPPTTTTTTLPPATTTSTTTTTTSSTTTTLPPGTTPPPTNTLLALIKQFIAAILSIFKKGKS